MQKNLLVIDNDIEMNEILEEVLKDESFNITFYEEIDDIKSVIEKHRPDLILLDFNLNGLNGGELCKIIKNDPEIAHLPVIIFSAFPKVIYSSKNYGYDCFIEKPFDIDEFIQTLHALSGGKDG